MSTDEIAGLVAALERLPEWRPCRSCGHPFKRVPYEIPPDRYRCRDCARVYFRRRREANLEAERERDRRRYRAEMADPERAAKRREYQREAARRRWADPEKRERAKAQHRAMVRRIYRDPAEHERREAYNEAQRIAYRLRRLDAGLPVREATAVRPTGKASSMPSAPLLAEVDLYLKHYGEDGWAALAAAAGVSERLRSRARRSGRIGLDAADKLATAIGVPLVMIYDDPEAA